MPVYPLPAAFALAQRMKTQTFPRIIAGPILRRVEATSVSVWVAVFNQSQNPTSPSVTLTVVSDQNNPTGSVLMQSTVGPNDPSQIPVGPFLSFVCVTASLSTGSQPLATNTLYYYSLTVDGAALDAPGVLTTSGGASARSIVALSGNILPSFCLPSAQLQTGQNVEGLRVAHAGCRKPHAESLDAMLTLYFQLTASATTVSGRPQQLYLTGDQIYADDVADVLLALLTDAGDTLMDSQEVLPSPPNTTPLTGQFLVPGKRASTITQNCGFSTTAGDSHLMTLGEFFAMYLFTFSDVLWPASLPAFTDVFPPADNPGVFATQQKTFKGTTVTIQHPWFAKYTQQSTDLMTFKKSLPKVRLVLANIATYMIFDDHEITDDWYMNGSWMDQVFPTPNPKNTAPNPALASRVIQNGLVAYAICQHWGNTPLRLLTDNAWTALRAALTSWVVNKFQPTGTDLANLATAVSIPPAVFGITTPEIPRTTPFLEWSYAIRWSIHELLVVDPRTRRGYGPYRNEAVIFSLTAVQGTQSEFAHWDTDLQGVTPLPANGLTFVVFNTPIVGIPVIEFFQSNGIADKQVAFDFDVEALGFSGAAFDAFLSGLAARTSGPRKIVMFTGDVHFGYAAGVEYWTVDTSGNQTDHISIANITSSALKNQTSHSGLQSTVHLHQNGYGSVLKIATPGIRTRFTWTATSADTTGMVIGTGVPLNAKGSQPANVVARVDVNYAGNPVAAIPDAGSVAGHLRSNTITVPPRSIAAAALYPTDGGADRGLTLPQTPTINTTDKEQRAAALLAAQQAAVTNAQQVAAGTQLVGVNNLGVITFATDASGSATKTIQELWWWIGEPAVLVNTYLSSAATADPPAPKAYSHFTVPFLANPVPSTKVLK